MLKEASFIHDLFAEEFAEGRAKALSQGLQEGLQQGRTEEAREQLLRLLRRQVGDVPETIATAIERLDLDRCRELTDRVLDGAPLEELGF
jgi:flagellar biosynthesis/type III secretory pathway protein FliH